jgi:hypothetical protein
VRKSELLVIVLIVKDLLAPAGRQFGFQVIPDFLAKVVFFLRPLPIHCLPSPAEGISQHTSLLASWENRRISEVSTCGHENG